MMRVRLKADGHLVEVISEGHGRVRRRRCLSSRRLRRPQGPARPTRPMRGGIRSQTRLTQAEFAARIDVPIETVRNWEQGKRSPRGPARALLKLLDHAPRRGVFGAGRAKSRRADPFRRTGLARSRRCGMVRVEGNCHSVRRSQRRPHSAGRSRHLGPARRLRAHRRAGARSAIATSTPRRCTTTRREVGEGLRASGVPRDEVFVTTKVWPSDLAPREFERRPRRAWQVAAAEVDLLLLHWPNPHSAADTLGALCKMKQEGLARHIGVSNFTMALLDEAMALSTEPLVCNQFECHPFLDQSKLIAASRKPAWRSWPTARSRAAAPRTTRC